MTKVSYSQLETFKRCRLRWYYRYSLNLEKRVKSFKPYRGSAIHECLEAHYKGRSWQDKLAEIEAKMRSEILPFVEDDSKRAEFESMPGEVARIVAGYLAAFAAHNREFEVLDIEREAIVTLPRGNLFEFKIDRRLRERATGNIFILDTKSVGTLPQEKVRMRDIQTALYAWADEQLTEEPVAGIIWEYVRTKAPRMPEPLKRGGISKAAIDTDWPTYRRAVLAAGLDPADYADMEEKLAGNAFYKRVKVPRPAALIERLVLEADYGSRQIAQIGDAIAAGRQPVFPRTQLSNCDWDCEFAELCYAQLVGQSGDSLIGSMYVERKKKDEQEDDD